MRNFLLECLDEFLLIHVGLGRDVLEFAFLVLGKALARVHLLARQFQGAAATVAFLAQFRDAAKPRQGHHGDQQDAQVTQDRVDGGHQRLEAHKRQREADQAGGDEDEAESFFAAAGEALAQGVEHAQRGSEDHAEDDQGHDGAHGRVEFGDQGQKRHVVAFDGLDLHQQRQRQQDQHDQVAHAAQQAAEAGSAGVQLVTADDDGHGRHADDVQARVVQGGDPPIRQ